jgi:hypothetical protein
MDATDADDAARADRELTLALEQGLEIPVSAQVDVVATLLSDDQYDRAAELATQILGRTKGGEWNDRYYRAYLLYLRGNARVGAGDAAKGFADMERAIALTPDETTRTFFRDSLADLRAKGQ